MYRKGMSATFCFRKDLAKLASDGNVKTLEQSEKLPSRSVKDKEKEEAQALA